MILVIQIIAAVFVILLIIASTALYVYAMIHQKYLVDFEDITLTYNEDGNYLSCSFKATYLYESSYIIEAAYIKPTLSKDIIKAVTSLSKIQGSSSFPVAFETLTPRTLTITFPLDDSISIDTSVIKKWTLILKTDHLQRRFVIKL